MMLRVLSLPMRIESVALGEPALPVEQLVVGISGDQHMCQKVWPETAARDKT